MDLLQRDNDKLFFVEFCDMKAKELLYAYKNISARSVIFGQGDWHNRYRVIFDSLNGFSFDEIFNQCCMYIRERSLFYDDHRVYVDIMSDKDILFRIRRLDDTYDRYVSFSKCCRFSYDVNMYVKNLLSHCNNNEAIGSNIVFFGVFIDNSNNSFANREYVNFCNASNLGSLSFDSLFLRSCELFSCCSSMRKDKKLISVLVFDIENALLFSVGSQKNKKNVDKS